jgi:hypothetical protein
MTMWPNHQSASPLAKDRPPDRRQRPFNGEGIKKLRHFDRRIFPTRNCGAV